MAGRDEGSAARRIASLRRAVKNPALESGVWLGWSRHLEENPPGARPKGSAVETPLASTISADRSAARPTRTHQLACSATAAGVRAALRAGVMPASAATKRKIAAPAHQRYGIEGADAEKQRSEEAIRRVTALPGICSAAATSWYFQNEQGSRRFGIPGIDVIP